MWKDPRSTATFYSFIAALRKKIRDEVKSSTPTHRFIRTLRDTNRLVRCYTQNIDGLEAREGLCTDLDRGKGNRNRFSRKSISAPKTPARQLPGGELDGGCEVVQLHGNLDLLRCNICCEKSTWEDSDREGGLLKGEPSPCPSCERSDQERRNFGRRGSKIGSLRPNVVLYGEEHPSADTIGRLSIHDLTLAPDVLLILGTSLQVHGLKLLVREFAKAVHAKTGGKGKVIFVNLSRPSGSLWKDVIDYWVSMDCDEWVNTLYRHRRDIWQTQEELKAQTIKAKSIPAQKLAVVVKALDVGIHGKNRNNDLPRDRKPKTLKRAWDLSNKVVRTNKWTGKSENARASPKPPPGRPVVAARSRKPLQSIVNESLGPPREPTYTVGLSDLDPDLEKCQQLQTPPISGHRDRFQDFPRNMESKRQKSMGDHSQPLQSLVNEGLKAHLSTGVVAKSILDVSEPLMVSTPRKRQQPQTPSELRDRSKLQVSPRTRYEHDDVENPQTPSKRPKLHN